MIAQSVLHPPKHANVAPTNKPERAMDGNIVNDPDNGKIEHQCVSGSSLQLSWNSLGH